ncbi:CDP-alcohol phosphatidyltransferase family protein [Pseudoalteromonas maricaloris]|nr:hypothetical protein [Pseudoalteromonas flavipulchra NCIMB 2033 = ATCC BAA-314]
MTSDIFFENFKDRVVKSCYEKMALFEKKYVAKKNVIEKIAFDLTRGDPTFQKLRDKILRKPAKLLIMLGIGANVISLIGAIFAILAAYFSENPNLFFIFIILNLFCDGIDGVVARYKKTQSDFGSLLDVTCDTFSLIVVSAGLYITGQLNILIFIAYSFIILLYTFRATLKTKIIDKVFLSVGSRVVAFSGLALISLSFIFQPVGELNFLSINILFSLILGILSIAYFVDVIKTKKC